MDSRSGHDALVDHLGHKLGRKGEPRKDGVQLWRCTVRGILQPDGKTRKDCAGLVDQNGESFIESRGHTLCEPRVDLPLHLKMGAEMKSEGIFA